MSYSLQDIVDYFNKQSKDELALSLLHTNTYIRTVAAIIYDARNDVNTSKNDSTPNPYTFTITDLIPILVKIYTVENKLDPYALLDKDHMNKIIEQMCMKFYPAIKQKRRYGL